MKTIALIIQHQGTLRFQVAHIEDEIHLYENPEDIGDDRDYWIVDALVDKFLANPFAYLPEKGKVAIEASNGAWSIEVTDYAPLVPEIYKASEIEARRKAARRKELLATMAPEDRALFQ